MYPQKSRKLSGSFWSPFIARKKNKDLQTALFYVVFPPLRRYKVLKIASFHALCWTQMKWTSFLSMLNKTVLFAKYFVICRTLYAIVEEFYGLKIFLCRVEEVRDLCIFLLVCKESLEDIIFFTRFPTVWIAKSSAVLYLQLYLLILYRYC